MSGKSQTIGDYTFSRPSQIFPIMERDAMFICDRGTGAKQFRGLVMSKSIADGRRLPRRFKFELSLVENDRRPSQKSGTRRENRNFPDSPDLSPFIPDDRGYLRFNKMTSVFYASVLLLIMNFVITLLK